MAVPIHYAFTAGPFRDRLFLKYEGTPERFQRAVAQHAGRSGEELVRAIATAYEVQVDLSRAISLHAHKIDHVAHLGPSVAAGLGTLLGLPTEVVYHASGYAGFPAAATARGVAAAAFAEEK